MNFIFLHREPIRSGYLGWTPISQIVYLVGVGKLNSLFAGIAGYIGSHTAVVLWQLGCETGLFDSFYNSNKSILQG
jgi:hypothetical protein